MVLGFSLFWSVMTRHLPEYEHPPLDEVVIGVQFEPLKDFHAVHLGRFWSRIRDRYPFTEDQAPIPAQIELAEPVPAPTSPDIAIGFPMPRCWFLDSTKNELLQLQSDRFLRNWRQISGTDVYPRFATLIDAFRRDWDEFQAFLQQEKLDRPSVNQCELTYINNLSSGEGWTDPSEVAKVFTVVRSAAKQDAFLPPPEVFSWDARYKLPDNRGRLRIKMHPAFRGRDLKVILTLNLTARGAPEAITPEGIFGWFGLAHEWIVRAFDELTDPGMHKLWGKKA
jgi:uncharacterized protein (TIGR04255 family)